MLDCCLFYKESLVKLIFSNKKTLDDYQEFTAGDGTWTHTWLPTTDFESASSAIPTRRRFLYYECASQHKM